MDTAATLRTLELLADGRDPVTGLALPDASPYNQPLVVRSLFAALRALESSARPTLGVARRDGDSSPPDQPNSVAEGPRAVAARSLPANAGKPWTTSEDETLSAAFDRGVAIKDLAVLHGRSTTALNARLFKLGKIADPGIPLRHPVQRAGKLDKAAGGWSAKASGAAASGAASFATLVQQAAAT
ncbi:MAG: hypothetical protein JNM76_14475 [Betaproteobacteria bacterium]|nr:hypothetical protein [Betaproteobacteria bacterium]